MAFQDDNTPTLANYTKQLFSPPVLAALRYALTALSPLLAVVGIVALSPQQIDKIVSVAQQFGNAAGAIAALADILIPLAAGIYGVIGATWRKQIQRMKTLAADPALAGSQANEAIDAQRKIIEATGALASNTTAIGTEAQKALVTATIELPNVQTIVADKALSDAVPSESVIASSAQ